MYLNKLTFIACDPYAEKLARFFPKNPSETFFEGFENTPVLNIEILNDCIYPIKRLIFEEYANNKHGIAPLVKDQLLKDIYKTIYRTPVFLITRRSQVERRGKDPNGFYRSDPIPQIHLYIDKIYNYGIDKYIVFQETLLHEYIHAFLDMYERDYAFRTIDKVKDQIVIDSWSEIEESLDNMLVLRLYYLSDQSGIAYANVRNRMLSCTDALNQSLDSRPNHEYIFGARLFDFFHGDFNKDELARKLTMSLLKIKLNGVSVSKSTDKSLNYSIEDGTAETKDFDDDFDGIFEHCKRRIRGLGFTNSSPAFKHPMKLQSPSDEIIFNEVSFSFDRRLLCRYLQFTTDKGIIQYLTTLINKRNRSYRFTYSSVTDDFVEIEDTFDQIDMTTCKVLVFLAHGVNNETSIYWRDIYCKYHP